MTALSAGASDMSGWLLMGLPGAIFISGISESWIAIGLTIGAYLNWKLVAGRLRVHTEANNNALTLPDYFTHRFEDSSKLLRIISAVVILVFFTIYCASGIVAGARLFESTFGMSYETALVGGCGGNHHLYLYRRVPGGQLDGHRAGQSDDFCADPDAGDGDYRGWWLLILDDGYQAKTPKYIDMLKGHESCRDHLAAGLGSGLFWPAAYSGALHGGRFPPHYRNARRISMTWMILCLAGTVLSASLGLRTSAIIRAQRVT